MSCIQVFNMNFSTSNLFCSHFLLAFEVHISPLRSHNGHTPFSPHLSVAL
jgi:hypothetical protein